MKVLVVHNFYQIPGGEDQVFRAEVDLLKRHGHEVLQYTDDNRRVPDLSRPRLAAGTIWSQETYLAVRDLIAREKPQVVHIHNTLPLISPSVYYAARSRDVPVIQTLHNYRLQCLPGDFVRRGIICEDCLGRAIPWPGVLHACYRGSRTSSAIVAAMLTAHRGLNTYRRVVDLYIALTEFARKKLVAGGLPAQKIVVKPNFVDPDPGMGGRSGGYALYVGRLSEPKGIRTLLAAWSRIGDIMPLKIVGGGPLAEEVERAALIIPSIQPLGWQSGDSVMEFMRNAKVLVFPSHWYEGLPLVITEAFATGLPVVASDLGAMSAIVEHRRTGLHFIPGDSGDLAEKIIWIHDHPQMVAEMELASRAEYEAHYTAEKNYEMLMAIYQQAIGRL